jgi:uncharacterized protein Veg
MIKIGKFKLHGLKWNVDKSLGAKINIPLGTSRKKITKNIGLIT